jgi:hypothetical protein
MGTLRTLITSGKLGDFSYFITDELTKRVAVKDNIYKGLQGTFGIMGGISEKQAVSNIRKINPNINSIMILAWFLIAKVVHYTNTNTPVGQSGEWFIGINNPPLKHVENTWETFPCSYEAGSVAMKILLLEFKKDDKSRIAKPNFNNKLYVYFLPSKSIGRALKSKR